MDAQTVLIVIAIMVAIIAIPWVALCIAPFLVPWIMMINSILEDFDKRRRKREIAQAGLMEEEDLWRYAAAEKDRLLEEEQEILARTREELMALEREEFNDPKIRSFVLQELRALTYAKILHGRAFETGELPHPRKRRKKDERVLIPEVLERGDDREPR